MASGAARRARCPSKPRGGRSVHACAHRLAGQLSKDGLYSNGHGKAGDLHFEVVRSTCGEGRIEEAGGEVGGPRGRATWWLPSESVVALEKERGQI